MRQYSVWKVRSVKKKLLNKIFQLAVMKICENSKQFVNSQGWFQFTNTV